MADYRKEDKGTIDTKVGGFFVIVGEKTGCQTDQLSYPESAIELVEERPRPNWESNATLLKNFYLKALMPGTYTIEYQRVGPPFRGVPEDIVSADVYKVNIKEQ